MGIDLGKLAAQGRAYSAVRPWEAEELDMVLLLERERGLSRITAADYVRNGVMSLEEFDELTDFTPKTLAEAHQEAEEKLKEESKKASSKKKTKSKTTK